MSLRPRGRQSVAAAAQRPYVLMFLCSSVSRVSGCRNPPTASALMSLEATRTPVRGRQPRSGLMCFLCNLMSLMFSALSGKHKRQIFCPSVLLFPALAATELPLGTSPSACWHINKQAKRTFMFFSILSQNIHPKTWHIHK